MQRTIGTTTTRVKKAVCLVVPVVLVLCVIAFVALSMMCDKNVSLTIGMKSPVTDRPVFKIEPYYNVTNDTVTITAGGLCVTAKAVIIEIGLISAMVGIPFVLVVLAWLVRCQISQVNPV